MTIKRIIGKLLIASPFIAIFAVYVKMMGWFWAVASWVAMALFVGAVALGVKWSMDE